LVRCDGDGHVGQNYDYNTDINMTSARARKILGYPQDKDGNPVAFSGISTDNMGLIDGVLYTDHAVAMRLAKSSAIWHGTVVSRNEQIIFQNSLVFNYDSRIHSRYHNNPNQYIKFGSAFRQEPDDAAFCRIEPGSFWIMSSCFLPGPTVRALWPWLFLSVGLVRSHAA